MPYAPWNPGGYYPFSYGAVSGPVGQTPSGPIRTAQNGVESGGALPGYNVAPAPTTGQGPYGLVPGTTPVPPSTFEQVNTAIPGLTGAGSKISDLIMQELQGEISPEAIRNMQDAAARFGITSGMPGSNAIPGTLANNRNLLSNILTTRDIQSQGQRDYANLLGAVGQQQTPQSLAAGLSQSNAQLRAAPDPTLAAQQQLANYYAALNIARGPGGGTFRNPVTPSSGTGFYSAPPSAAPSPGPFYGGTPSPSPFAPTSAPISGDFTSYFDDLSGETPYPGGAVTSSYQVPEGYDTMQDFYNDLGG